jgi:predicted aldo/keto reductase-like oxidoreductase
MTYLGEKIPKLGFGLMRLPMIGSDVDMEQTCKMVDLFMANGFTYFDTAYGYINGKSEEAAKTALVDRYPRESFQFATKLPAWDASTTEEAQNMFWTSLERTGAGYFDFYLLHNLGEYRSQYFDDYEIWDFVQEQKKNGLIRHVGFSFHDKAKVLDGILTDHPEVEFVQLQINYVDWESNSVESRKCYEVACKHKKPIIIMEPVKGGTLANLPPAAQKIFEEADSQSSAASWALRYAASMDNIITVLSGMSTISQMEDNLSCMANFRPLIESEKAVIAKVQRVLGEIPSIPCTACEYCIKECPQKLPIHQIFKSINRKMIFNDLRAAKSGYNWDTRLGGKASICIACGNCELVCPQHLDIIESLKIAVDLFE